MDLKQIEEAAEKFIRKRHKHTKDIQPVVLKDFAEFHLEQSSQDKETIQELVELMQEFCDRVDKGEVRSTKTYSKFKAALSKVKPTK